MLCGVCSFKHVSVVSSPLLFFGKSNKCHREIWSLVAGSILGNEDLKGNKAGSTNGHILLPHYLIGFMGNTGTLYSRKHPKRESERGEREINFSAFCFICRSTVVVRVQDAANSLIGRAGWRNKGKENTNTHKHTPGSHLLLMSLQGS